MIQLGARRNYIYARQLEAAGMLGGLFVDFAFAKQGAGMMANALSKLPRLRGALSRRTVIGVPAAKLHASIVPNVVALAGRFMHPERMYPLADEAMAVRFARNADFLSADVLVSYHGNGGSLLERARARGARIVTDFVITPSYLQIEQAERERWPGWESETTPPAIIEAYRRRMERLVRLSDICLCPSPAVARDLASLDGFDPGKVRINPYGVSGVNLRPRDTRPGRVLFAGAAGLRKGLPYIAEAARILRDEGSPIEIVIAGAVEPSIRARLETRALTFLGRLGPADMAGEFARADVYCLPSLAEGSATSIFEAMANGLPVVTTPSSGSVVSDGQEGFIVPERDGPALARALALIVADRDLRDRMSAAATAAAQAYDDESCGRRFLGFVREAALMT